MMSDQNTKDIREIRENQIKLQTQFAEVIKNLHSLSEQISNLLKQNSTQAEKIDKKIDTLKEKIYAELKTYVQFKDISLLQKIIYGGVGTALTFIGLALLALLIPQS